MVVKLRDDGGNLHEIDSAIRFESRLDPDAVRLELKAGGLDDSLMKIREGGIFHEYVPLKGQRWTIGAGYGDTTINEEVTEKRHEIHAKIETQDLFFQLDYLKSQRDNGKMNEYRATLHKKMTKNMTYGLDALYFDGKTDVHYDQDASLLAFFLYSW